MEISLKLNITFKGESTTLGGNPNRKDQETQTAALPIIALETRHLDCLQGPISAKPIEPFLFIEELSPQTDEAPELQTVKQPAPALMALPSERGAQTIFTIARGPLDTLGFFSNQSDKYVLLEPQDSRLAETGVLSRAFNLDYFLTRGHWFSENIKNAYRAATKGLFYAFMDSRL